MKRFNQPPEPPDFDHRARKPGNAWLQSHLDGNGKLPPGVKPPGHWRDFKSQLADGFGDLCAYTAMFATEGTVDHYLSCKNHPSEAYEWSNYRFVMGWVNSSKGTLDEAVLDPFEVQDDWFEIILPSLQLHLTERVPEDQRERARFTIKKLHLEHDERVIRLRRRWYKLYLDGALTLEGLERVAPLIAKAIRQIPETE